MSGALTRMLGRTPAAPSGHRHWRLYSEQNNGTSPTVFPEVVFASTVGGAHVGGGTPYGGGSGTAVNVPSNAFDGTSTYYGRNATTDVWIAIDYGSPTNIVEARLQGRTAGLGMQFTVQRARLEWSDDAFQPATNWTVAVAAYTWGNIWIDNEYRSIPETIAAGTYKSFRLNITSCVGGSLLVVSEIEWRATVGGTDLTNGYSGTTGLPYGNNPSGSNPPSVCYDNSYAAGSYWPASGTTGQNGFAFLTPQTLAEVGIGAFTNTAWCPKDFTIQGSNDGINFTTLKTLTGQTTGWAATTLRLYSVP